MLTSAASQLSLNISFWLQVRSPFPMIPIGGIQMVHSVPASVPTPLVQQAVQPAASRLALQKSTSEDSTSGEAAHSFAERGRRGGAAGETSQEKAGGARQEPEESIQTCTKAIASLCIGSEEPTERGGGGDAAPSSSSGPDSQQQQRFPSISTSPHPSPSPPQGPGIQHFSSLELRPPFPPSSSSPHPQSPGADGLQPPAACKALKPERDREESTTRSHDVS